MSETLLNQNQINPIDWVKPADWIDIRSGALTNSVYFLVGHSADYTTYPTFTVRASVSSSGTYDVFVDGVKQASAVASGTTTTLTWSTLALTTGYDVTYPAALRTHIVRVTPTSSSNTLTAINKAEDSTYTSKGTLWIHFSITNRIEVSKLCADEYYNFSRDKNPVLEAITAEGDELQITGTYGLAGAFSDCANLKYLPVIEGNGSSISGTCAFVFDPSLKTVRLKNIKVTGYYNFAKNGIKNIICDNASVRFTGHQFYQATSLQKLPAINIISDYTDYIDVITDDADLKDTFLDLTDAVSAKIVSCSNTSGLKGLIVSSSAPFDSATSPQIDVSSTGLDRAALVNLFNSLPTVTGGQVINVTSATGASSLDATDLAIATAKGWTVTR